MADAITRVAALDFWRGAVEPVPLGGGITNINFRVADHGEVYFVRVGNDIPHHLIMRFSERAASNAAHRAGLSPEVVHGEPGILVMRFIDGRTLEPGDIARPETLVRVIELLKTCHRTVPRYLAGPALIFWVFHVLRDYGRTLRASNSPHIGKLGRLLEIAEGLEAEVGDVKIVFGHNDLLAANFIDDGIKLWLIDWDYAGFNSPLFDLANLAGNNAIDGGQEIEMLGQYFGAPPGQAVLKSYGAMKCASLLREAMWSMVSEHFSDLDFDFATYTQDNLARFERAYADFSA
jgi:thiamine kinase-like enzyme